MIDRFQAWIVPTATAPELAYRQLLLNTLLALLGGADLLYLAASAVLSVVHLARLPDFVFGLGLLPACLLAYGLACRGQVVLASDGWVNGVHHDLIGRRKCLAH